MAATADRSTAALAVVGRGLALFDLPPGQRAPLPGWQARATTDPVRVREWLSAGANLGIGCRASGVVGIDLDRHPSGPDGVARFAAVCAAARQLWPLTLTTATPNHGVHLYFRVPPDLLVVSTSGGRSGLGPGIDTRGPGRRTGGYLVAPGSVVAAGAYTVAQDRPIADLPHWLAHLLARPPVPRRD